MDVRELRRDNDNEVHTDYTMQEILSFSFCNAQIIANQRLHRLDELKAVVDQAIDGKRFFEFYMDLREDIISSHAVEKNLSDKDKRIAKEEMKKQNKEAFYAMQNFLMN